jgi:hypothetical protein
MQEQVNQNSISNEELIAAIKEFELQEKRNSMRYLDFNAIIKTTAEYAKSTNRNVQIKSEYLTIERKRKSQLILWIIMGLLILIPMFYGGVTHFRKPDSNPMNIIVPIIFLLLFIFVGYGNLTKEDIVNPIILTPKNITINKQTFDWKNIRNTFWVYRRKGEMFFVIGEKNGGIFYFEIDNQLEFNYSHGRFSKIVEHFRELYS